MKKILSIFFGFLLITLSAQAEEKLTVKKQLIGILGVTSGTVSNGFKELNNICSVIRKQNGGVLFIDYGYVSENMQNTLQSVYKHKFNDLSKNIGNADITSLVNFDLYKKYFLYKNLSVEKIISQSQFLQKMGILERSKMLSHKMDYKRKIDLYSRIQRLINPNMMGETFKVIFAKNKKCKFSLAFK